MKRSILILIILTLITGCGLTQEDGRIIIEAIDTPPPEDIDHIWLTITEVRVHSSDNGWKTLVASAATYDFLELINGTTAVLCDEALEPGHYTQLWLKVANTNEIVIDGISYPLIVPSGVETGVKLSLAFDVVEDEIIEIVVDFEVSKSIVWNPGQYILRPAFRAFKKVLSRTVSGTVKDTSGAGICNALCEAITSTDTTATLTDSNGAYKLILLEGTYNIQASADGYTKANTIYTGVDVNAGIDLTGYDFTLQ